MLKRSTRRAFRRGARLAIGVLALGLFAGPGQAEDTRPTELPY